MRAEALELEVVDKFVKWKGGNLLNRKKSANMEFLYAFVSRYERKMKLKNRRMLSFLMAIVMVLTMIPFHPLEANAKATPTLDLGNPVSVTETTYQLPSATITDTGVVDTHGGYFTVAVNNGSIAVGTVPGSITEMTNGIKIINVSTDISTPTNRVFNFSGAATYEDIQSVIRNMTFTQVSGQTQSVTVNVTPGAPLADGKTSVRTYNGRYFVYVARQSTMTFYDAVNIATNNNGHLVEPSANNPGEMLAIASMFKEFKSFWQGSWYFISFIGATKTTAPNWNTSSYSETRYVSNGQPTGLDSSSNIVPNGSYDHITLVLNSSNTTLGYLPVLNIHGSSTYKDPGVIVEYNSGVISVITATKDMVISAPTAPVEVSKTATSITLQAVTGQEYSKDGGVTWQDSPTFSGLTPNTDYTFVTRVKATATQNASPISAGIKIRTMSSNADLKNLTLSSGTLSPAFAAGTTNYTSSSVANSVYETTVTATVYDSVYATVTASVYNSANVLVKGPITLTSGAASDSLPLSVGSNTIKVVVTAQDGTTQTYTVTVIRNDSSGSGSDSGSGSGSGSGTGSGTGSGGTTVDPTPASGVKTTVNGTDSSFATSTTADNVTTVAIDKDKLSDYLSKGNGQKLNVIVPGDGSIKVTGLTAATLKQLSDTGSTLNIENLLAIYPIPSKQLDLSSVTKQWSGAPLGDIAVDINIKSSSDALKAAAKDHAAKGGYDLLVNPVDLSLSFTYQGQSVKPDQLTSYAPRYIALPEGIDPNKITTGVVVNPDGTVFHVPTVVTKINNRYFALINDLRSQGSYSVIWNPQNFDDVKNHWAKESINNIAARLQLEGTGNNTFSPDRSIERSEFATIVASGLGLMRQGVANAPYSDVARSNWYHDAVTIASEFGIIEGFEDGAFHGSALITREQGIAMIARSLHLVQPQKALGESEINQILAPYGDSDKISGYARESAAQLIKAGILQGRDNQLLKPKAELTRAETAALLERLLKVTKLIDK